MSFQFPVRRDEYSAAKQHPEERPLAPRRDEFLVGADRIADASENADPEPGAKRCEEAEPQKIHTSDTCRKRNVLAHDRNESTNERTDLAMFFQIPLHVQKLLLR